MSIIEKNLEEALTEIKRLQSQAEALNNDPELQKWGVYYDNAPYKSITPPLNFITIFSNLFYLAYSNEQMQMEYNKRLDKGQNPENLIRFLSMHKNKCRKDADQYLKSSGEFINEMKSKHASHPRLEEIEKFIESMKKALGTFKKAQTTAIRHQINRIKAGDQIADLLLEAKRLRKDPEVPIWGILDFYPHRSINLESLYRSFRYTVHLKEQMTADYRDIRRQKDPTQTIEFLEDYKVTLQEDTERLLRQAGEYLTKIRSVHSTHSKLPLVESFIQSMQKEMEKFKETKLQETEEKLSKAKLNAAEAEQKLAEAKLNSAIAELRQELAKTKAHHKKLKHQLAQAEKQLKNEVFGDNEPSRGLSFRNP